MSEVCGLPAPAVCDVLISVHKQECAHSASNLQGSDKSLLKKL